MAPKHGLHADEQAEQTIELITINITLMQTTTENAIMFDDLAIIQSKLGESYLTKTAENLSPDCNCSGYTSIEEDEEYDTTQIA